MNLYLLPKVAVSGASCMRRIDADDPTLCKARIRAIFKLKRIM